MAIIGVSGYSGSGKDTVGKMIQIATCFPGSITMPLEELLADYDNQQWWLEEQSGWKIKKWAGKLKVVASMLTGIPIEKFEDQEFKKTFLPEVWNNSDTEPEDWCVENHWEKWKVFVSEKKNATIKLKDIIAFARTCGWEDRMTVRDFLQRLGTEGLRDGLHPNTWVNALMADYKPVWNDPDPIAGSDYTITYRENYGEISLIHYGSRSEAEVFNHEIIEPNWIITDTRFPNEAQAIKNAGGIIIRVDRPGFSAINAHPSETALDDWEFDYLIGNESDLTSLLFTVGSILRKEKILQ